MNPLVIQAGVGMGKTHVLTEIGEKLYKHNDQLLIHFTDAEAFTSEMVNAFAKKTIQDFRNKYRLRTGLLLFDDVQGLAGRNRTQEELLHIFNDIVTQGGQVVFTSNVAIHELENFIEPLKSRLLSGVIAEIKPPEYEERVQLLKLTSDHHKLEIEDSVLRSIAAKGQKDIRELVGSVIGLHLQAKLENRPLNNEFIAYKGWVQEARKENVTLGEIITLVEHNFGVCRTDLMSKSRKSLITWARQVAMFLARHYTLLPLQEIGKLFGRDHATVIHAFQKVKETMEKHPTRRYEVEFLMQKLKARTGRDANV